MTVPQDEIRLRTAIEKAAASLGMDVELATGTGDNLPRRSGRSHVTVLGQPLRPRAIAAIAVANCSQ